MRSKWTLTCDKVSAGIVIKKFERLMAVKMTDVKVERVLFQGRKLEVLHFFLDSPEARDWDGMVLAQLKFCEKFSHRWQMQLVNKNLSGRWEFGGIGGNHTIAGVVDAAWEISADQLYSSMTLLGDEPDMW